MRLLALVIILALCACAHSATLRSFKCPSGVYVINKGALTDCPTRITPPAPAALDETLTESTATISQTGGTAYACVYLDTATDPDFDQVVAGTDGDDVACVDVSTLTPDAAALAFDGSDNHTGLVAQTSYRVAHTILRNGKRSYVVISEPFITLPGPEQEESTLIVVESEAANINTPGPPPHAWTGISSDGASGTAMQSLPDQGTAKVEGYAATEPHLQYLLDFTETGTHYVWVRGKAADGGADSVHVGLNGAEVSTAENLGGFGTAYQWANLNFANERRTVEIPTAAQHTIDVWQREDGFVLDRLILTTDADYVPTGLGPDASPSTGIVVAPLFSPVPGTFATTVDVTPSTTTSGATVYYTTDGSTPDATDTAFTVPFTLSATTTVKAIGIKGGSTDSAVATGVYSKVAAGGADLTGSGIFFDCDAGDDGAAGTQAAPVLTLARAKVLANALGAGADVYGLSASVCDDQKISVNWGNNSNDWATLGCYYMDGATPKECTDAQPNWEMNGAYSEGAFTAGSVPYTSLSCAPECGPYDAAITVASNYVRVARVTMKQFASRGINVSGRDHVKLEYTKGYDLAGQWFVIENGSTNVAVIGGDVDGFAHGHAQKHMGGSGVAAATAVYRGPYGGAMSLPRNPNAKILIHGVTVKNGFGEASNCNNGSSHIIVRNSVFSNFASTGLYNNSCSNVIYENNILALETSSGDFSGRIRYINNAPRFGQAGNGWEDHQLPYFASGGFTGNGYRNNLYVNLGSCAYWGVESSARAAGRKVAARHNNNFCIDPHFGTVSQGAPSANIGGESEIINSVYWDTLGTGSCSMVKGTVSNNFWASRQDDQTCRDAAGDVVAANPTITNTQALSAWTPDRYGSGTMPTFEDIRPLSSSPLIGAMDVGCLTEKYYEADDYGWAYDQMPDVGDFTEDQWEYGCVLSATNEIRSVGTNAIGPMIE